MVLLDTCTLPLLAGDLPGCSGRPGRRYPPSTDQTVPRSLT